MNGHTIIKNL